MNRAKVQRKIMIIAAGLVLLSVVSLIITLLSLQEISAGVRPGVAAKAFAIVMILHVLVLLG